MLLGGIRSYRHSSNDIELSFPARVFSSHLEARKSAHLINHFI